MVRSTPQRLGGGGHGDGTGSNTTGLHDSRAKMLTPDEIRRRRIEALDRTTTAVGEASSNNNVYPPSLPSAAAKEAEEIQQLPAVTFVPELAATNMDSNDDYFPDDEVDDELQAALALSLQDATAVVPAGNHTINFETPNKISLSSEGIEQSKGEALPPPGCTVSKQSVTDETMQLSASSIVTHVVDNNMRIDNPKKIALPINHAFILSQGEPLQDMSKYHKILWDDHLTTESDKNRWVSQGIDVRGSTGNQITGNIMMDTDTDDTTKTNIAIIASNCEGIEVQQQSSTKSSMMESVTTSHLSWGLIQQHGGPCGVLAAIQAEILRTLLFINNSNNVTAVDTTATIENHIDTLNPLRVRRALARAIAVVLSRAALAPPSNSNSKIDKPSTAVCIVLPTNGNQELTWQDLEPWYPVQPISNTPSTTLKVYSIPISAIDEPSFVDSSTAATIPLIEPVESTNTITPKRQKVLTVEVSNETVLLASSIPNQSLHSRIDRMADIVEGFLLINENHDHHSNSSMSTTAISDSSPLDSFRRPGGVLLLVMSLIASRTVPMIMDDFDDPIDTRLTAQFGHCSQELINLLLTGHAVSNVFDNTLSPSGDMICRGIQSRPVIGYLTQLEAMRYCEVGGYYKMPLFPIWVVGSTSHFTVLFGDPASLKESKSDMLLDECRRVFKAVEGGEEHGFIQADQLTTVLKNLKIDIGGSNEADETARIQTLAASLEVSGAGIILWDDFWKAASRLLTGASLETILHSNGGTSSISPINVASGNEPPLLISNFAANDDIQFKPEARRPTAAGASVHSDYIESDEEMARRLAAEWDNAGAADGMLALSNSPEILNFPPSLVNNDPQPGSMGDEEYAQYLQKQFDSENAVDAAIAGVEGGSVAAISGSPFPALSDTDETTSCPATPTQNLFAGEDDFEDAKPAAQVTSSNQSLPFEQYGDTFSLYHYNGLRVGVLTPFRITRLTAEEAVGASIALNRGTGVASSHGSSGTQDLEDVVRTKWPSCAINWLGKTPPCID